MRLDPGEQRKHQLDSRSIFFVGYENGRIIGHFRGSDDSMAVFSRL